MKMARGTRKSGAVTSTTDEHPTLLRTPGRHGFPRERILTGCASDYTVDEPSFNWFIVHDSRGGVVFMGWGPVSVLRSPAPF